MNTAFPHARSALPLLGMAVVALAVMACHRADDDAMATPPPASTAMPATTMPAAPSTMTSPTSSPMPATSAGAYGAQGTSNEAPPAQSAGMPPPVDTPQDGTRDDAAPTNPAAPPDGNQ